MSSDHSSCYDSSSSQHLRYHVDRQICQRRVEWKNPPPLATPSRKFLELVKTISNHQQINNNDDDERLESFKETLQGDYKNETDFDERFFQDLREFLKEDTVEQSDENMIVLGSSTAMTADDKKFAVGFVRQTCIKLPLCRRKKEEEKTIHTGKSDFLVDHAVCLLSQDETSGVWNVLDCFAIVEFKLSHSSCHKFELSEDGNVDDRYISFEEQHAALGQAIAYTVRCVYLYHARRGKLRDRVKKSLPLAILAARKVTTRKKQKSQQADTHKTCRWVSGQFQFPEVCGGRFYFSVESYGGFFEKGSNYSKSVANALSLYFDTMSDGLTVALQVQRELVNGSMPSPDPSSGLNLRLGPMDLNLNYCASPIYGANATQGIGMEGWKISQGDLFQGKLNIQHILDLEESYAAFASPGLAEENVIVKVSSTLAHSCLVSPSLTWLALLKIQQIHRRFPDRIENAVNEIGTVLYAAFPTDVGLVTIMSDLTKKGYSSLRPQDYFEKQNTLLPLWESFANLARNVLLPLATVKVIYPDIRPGFDGTSNILCLFDSTMPTMKLIDYESLVCYSDWITFNLDGRYIRKQADWTPTTFVWWQCVTIAFVWKMELPQSSLRKNEGEGKKMNDLANVVLCGRNGEHWLKCLRSFAQKTDKGGVLDVLDFLGKWFDGTDSQFFTDFLLQDDFKTK